MRASIRIFVAGFALVALVRVGLAQGLADGTNPMPAIRADRWADAETIAARIADPVAQKLVVYYRLIAPGGATLTEIAAFMRANPDWPGQALLERRRQEALAPEPDDATALAQCAASLSRAGAMLRCAEAHARVGQAGDATAMARRAWVETVTDQAAEAAFLRRWPGIVSADDEWARFQRLAWTDLTAAARQVARLSAARQAVAEARLALRRDETGADARYDALPPASRGDPGLVLDRARNLRRTNRFADAAALWVKSGEAAQGAAPDHLGAFWSERHALGRRLLREWDYKRAYDVVAGHGETNPENATEAEFLAGFVALRYLKDPARATRHFQTLANLSKAAITQGRAHYWLGRAAQAAGRDPTDSFKQSARWATTFYGQMSSVALGEKPEVLAARVRDLRDPPWTSDVALAFTGHEVIRAAAWLIAWGEPGRARLFLVQMDQIAPVMAERSLTAAFALRAGMPDGAVFVARRIGRDGAMLPETGWPMPFEPPADFDAAIALGIMRQESSFDIGAISPSGARGLMQLMPFTARDVAKKLGVPTSLVALTSDTGHNMRLGTTYLRDMLARFDNSLPMAAAAYNAGPHRVDQWLVENGDPRTGAIGMLDWMELIPFNETRNYAQRVLENIVIYRAKRGDTTATLMAEWAR